jgi:hypothetical protein
MELGQCKPRDFMKALHMFIIVTNFQDFISLNKQAFQLKPYCLFPLDHYEYMQRRALHCSLFLCYVQSDRRSR